MSAVIMHARAHMYVCTCFILTVCSMAARVTRSRGMLGPGTGADGRCRGSSSSSSEDVSYRAASESVSAKERSSTGAPFPTTALARLTFLQTYPALGL